MSEAKYHVVTRKGKAMTACKAFVRDWQRARQKIRRYAKKVGGTGVFKYSPFSYDLIEFEFSRQADVPSSWTRLNGEGMSRPKKNSPDKEKFDSLTLPRDDHYVRELVGAPAKIEYTYRGCSDGFTHPSCDGMFKSFGLFWFSPDGPFLLMTPDIAGEMDEMLADKKEYPGLKFSTPRWEFSLSGCREIIRPEWDVIVHKAKAKAAAEKKTRRAGK